MRYLDVSQTVDYTERSRSSVKQFFKRLKDGYFIGQVEDKELAKSHKFVEWRKGSKKMVVSEGFIQNHFSFKRKKKAQKEEMTDFIEYQAAIDRVELESLRRENERLKRENERQYQQNDHLNRQIESYLEKEKQVILLCRNLQQENAAFRRQKSIESSSFDEEITGQSKVILATHSEGKKPMENSVNKDVEDAKVVFYPQNEQSEANGMARDSRPEIDDIQELSEHRRDVLTKQQKIKQAEENKMDFMDWLSSTDSDQVL